MANQMMRPIERWFTLLYIAPLGTSLDNVTKPACIQGKQLNTEMNSAPILGI